jgi:AMMECR1 domain-containing protein
LPEVASEQGWDKKTTIKSLLRKADYDGKLEDI